MSFSNPFLLKRAFSVMVINNSFKVCLFNLLILYSLSVLGFFSLVKADKSAFDIQCMSVENCSAVTGNKMCNSVLGVCSCAEGNVRMKHYNHCLPYASMGEYCQDTEQCMQGGPHAVCGKWSQRCECLSGFKEKRRNSTTMCLKSPQIVNEPYIVHMFGNLDTVHIILGCLTGGLALLACFAGIIQLVRKKCVRGRCNLARNSHFYPDFGFSTASAPSQSQPYSDSQYTSTLPSGGDFAILDGNSTGPPTPGTLGDEEYVVTPPPTYEEAVQSSRAKAASVMTV